MTSSYRRKRITERRVRGPGRLSIAKYPSPGSSPLHPSPCNDCICVCTAIVVKGGDDLHVAVQLEVDGTPTVELAPVADREPYEVGETVEGGANESFSRQADCRLPAVHAAISPLSLAVYANPSRPNIGPPGMTPASNDVAAIPPSGSTRMSCCVV